MKIIDAHLHLFSEDSAEEMARQVGHHNNVDHLREVYGELHIAHGVVMGNHSLELRRHEKLTIFILFERVAVCAQRSVTSKSFQRLLRHNCLIQSRTEERK